MTAKEKRKLYEQAEEFLKGYGLTMAEAWQLMGNKLETLPPYKYGGTTNKTIKLLSHLSKCDERFY